MHGRGIYELHSIWNGGRLGQRKSGQLYLRKRNFVHWRDRFNCHHRPRDGGYDSRKRWLGDLWNQVILTKESKLWD
jgi:hypothetical protein